MNTHERIAAGMNPRYKPGVALTYLQDNDTWYVVTSLDAVAYPTYKDALAAWRVTTEPTF